VTKIVICLLKEYYKSICDHKIVRGKSSCKKKIYLKQDLFSKDMGQGLANPMAYGLVPVQCVQEVREGF